MTKRIREDGDHAEIIGDITHGAFANPLLGKILRKFGKKAFSRSSACMEFEVFLRQCLKCYSPDPKMADKMKTANGDCLEIGTFYGVTAVVLSQYFRHVYCVSVDNMDVRLKYDIVDYLGIHNITFLDCTDNEKKDAVIAGLRFDFAYLDGDHAHDTQSDFEAVRRCGRVLFHEACPLQPPVWNLCHSLPQDEMQWAAHDWFAFWERRG